MNISIIATFIAKAGYEAQLQTLFMQVIEPTLQETGCIKYALHINKENPQEFIFIEEWQSQNDLDKHLKTTHIQKLFNDVQGLIEFSEIKKLQLL
ncbi:putative quinol monooxygenase [Acinetobacter nectaris]|uniref:putative quinol monooxygenase n=1 Tax=Acinetobacter nectaris TaxID=1219382 RepID=UPI001F393CB3|nr:putative quinol monooxygenase [Acinetobacter nectaris]MCF9047549.1 antibiotic biosynthesis monooxygenase [Acinetobacter nectaris]